MKASKLLFIFLVILIAIFLASFVISKQNSANEKEIIKVIVEVDPSYKAIAKQSLSEANVKFRHTYSSLFSGYSLEIQKSKIKELEKKPYIKGVYPVHKFEIIKPVKSRNTKTITEDKRNEIIGGDYLWNLNYTGKSVTIAILDTGIDENHPDLIGEVKAKESFVDTEGTEDGYGHGTHVASLAAGTGAASNGKYKGVAPEAMLLNVKVCDSEGSCYEDDIISGLEWAVQHNADIISMSLGGVDITETYPLNNAVKKIIDDGIIVIAAAGNENY